MNVYILVTRVAATKGRVDENLHNDIVNEMRPEWTVVKTGWWHRHPVYELVACISLETVHSPLSLQAEARSEETPNNLWQENLILYNI